MIPQQKILVGDKTLLSDSIRINVSSISVDTTKQKLYDIKPLIDVKKPSLKKIILKWLLIFITIIVLLSITAYYWKKRKFQTNNIASSVPPYDFAKLALSKLNEENAYKNDKIKIFYSDLSLILRTYLNDKVYDQSLESTTDELLAKLRTLNKSKKIFLKEETIKNIEATLKRADLVKFAKSKPELEIIRMDKKTIENEIERVKEGLPKPTIEEIEQTIEFQLYQQKKKRENKLKRILVGTTLSILILILTSGYFYGFKHVKDTILRNPSMLLLKKDWILSEYGAPGIIIETPTTLIRRTTRKLNNTFLYWVR